MTDEKFVLDLYLHVLGREPDPDGVKHWTGVLADGVSRSDVLEQFMSSPEFHSMREIRERLKGLSPELAHLTVPEQEMLLRLQERVVQREENHPESQQHLSGDGRPPKPTAFAKLSAQVWTAKDAIGQRGEGELGMPNQSEQPDGKSKYYPLTWYTPSLQAFHEQVAKAIEEHGKAIAAIEHLISRIEQELLFKGALRTAELAIQEQLLPYTEFFRGLSPIVDLGCGRGEFLELLKDQGAAAYGVDSDPQACEVARRKHLEVIQENAVEHLRELPDCSLGGIFAARLIEYLPANVQLEFLALCSSKLKPNGVVVIETTNPDSQQGFGRISCLDPTHLRPVPPELMKTLLESKGLRDVRISVLAPVEASLAPAAAAKAVGGQASRAQTVCGASNRLSSSSTYAVVGWRKATYPS